METPDGYDELIQVFGDLRQYIGLDGRLKPEWEAQYLSHAQLPFTIPLSGMTNVNVSRIYCHKLLVPVVEETFKAVLDNGCAPMLHTYGGCFNFRTKRLSSKLSTHSWGIAIDLNPESNAQGTRGSMSRDIVNIFRHYGWKWGGDWAGNVCDPMHFQFVTGY